MEYEMSNENNSTVELNKETWTVDKSHTKIQFSARHMIISEVTGQFNEYELKLNATKDFSDVDVELEIQVNSINTGIADRDNHLKSPDFFDVENFPKMIFKSKSVKVINEEKFKLFGDLRIRDVTKPIELDVTYGGTIKDPWGFTRAGFKVQGSVNRFDYNLKWNALMETGGAVVSKNINIICDVEVTKQTN
jgi:polyisoprenoid-binding protein YceI